MNTNILALDLSLNATGYAVYAVGRHQVMDHGEIATPRRANGQTDSQWNAARYLAFSVGVLGLLTRYRPSTVVMEVSTKVFGNNRRGGRYGAGAQYRAGQGLGRAMGWIDGVMAQATAYGLMPVDVIPMNVNKAKQSITGNRTANKDTVRGFLEDQLSCSLETWKPGAVDALSVLLTYTRDRGMKEVFADEVARRLAV